MKYTHILWDFNGTILDDVQTGIKSINTLLERRNLPVIPDESYYKDVFTFPIINYYKRLGFDFSKEPFDIIAHEWVKEYMENVKDAGVNDGVMHLLERLKSAGIRQYILSATQSEMLDSQLGFLGIKEYFENCYGLDNIYAESKTALGKKMISDLNPQKALLIGDTSHDYETALEMGIDCVLCACGHMKKEDLVKCSCFVFDSIKDVEKYIFDTI